MNGAINSAILSQDGLGRVFEKHPLYDQELSTLLTDNFKIFKSEWMDAVANSQI